MPKITKALGQFFTPTPVAKTLVRWVVRSQEDVLLDPSCGNGEFLVHHAPAIGVELSPQSAKEAAERAPSARVTCDDFFPWAEKANQRFDAIAGNPPFIRYHTFSGERRWLALRLSARRGVQFSGLTSSWAPFLVVSCSLLKPGGRIGFVVPAEIGHATYAAPLIEYLAANFDRVLIVALKEKIFPALSEDAWLLYADGYGGSSRQIMLAIRSRFSPSQAPPRPTKTVSLEDWRRNGRRLRKFLLPSDVLELYEASSRMDGVVSLGKIARTSIGYVTGDNAFFHLRPSEAKKLGIPNKLLRVSVRKSQQLTGKRVDDAAVRSWIEQDREVLLLDLSRAEEIPASVKQYLDSSDGQKARLAYKCRTRNPWYAVPDVSPPDAFLTYMNGNDPALIANEAGCVCTNSLLAVRLVNGESLTSLIEAWRHPLAVLSQEIEGHPLGGGMLKLEPGEAARVKLPLAAPASIAVDPLVEGISVMRQWRHCKSYG